MLSISNIAWDASMDLDVSEILVNNNISCIDIAPPKYFPNPSEATDDEILLVKDYWKKKEIAIIGMQSLLFGTHGFNIFGDGSNQAAMLYHLSHICHIGKLLGAKKLVFGSPRNRDRSHLDDDTTQYRAKNFFYRLGDIAKENDVIVCLEPNPTCYNSNFMVDSLETAKVVQHINHSNIKMQLDIGSMFINNEKPNEIIPKISHLVGHVHISEPQLAPLNINNEYHQIIAPLLQKYLPEKDITIEMLTSNEKVCLSEIEQSIEFVKNVYHPKALS